MKEIIIKTIVRSPKAQPNMGRKSYLKVDAAISRLQLDMFMSYDGNCVEFSTLRKRMRECDRMAMEKIIDGLIELLGVE